MSEPRIESTVAASIYAVRRESRIRQYYLEQIDGPGVRERIPLEKDQVIVGRANDADIAVPSTWVSRYHARLVRRGTDYLIRDNESQNGIFLNGVKA